MQWTIEVEGHVFRVEPDPAGGWLDVFLAHGRHKGLGFSMSAAASNTRIEFRCRQFLGSLDDSGIAYE